MGCSKEILRALMDPAEADPVPWCASDLGAILGHQLAVPLAAEQDFLAELAGCPWETMSAGLERAGFRTFGDLLLSPAPPPARFLRLLKQYAKAALTEGRHLPRDVARVLYVATIVRGRREGVSDMTSLDDERVEREVRRCLTYGWLPADLREQLRDRRPAGS